MGDAIYDESCRVPGAFTIAMPIEPGKAGPVVFGILIIIIVFFPILSLQGMEGKMFQPLAYTIIIALLISILLPALSKAREQAEKREAEERVRLEKERKAVLRTAARLVSVRDGDKLASVPVARELIERVAFEAREDKRVDRKSGVSQRLPISALENAVDQWMP